MANAAAIRRRAYAEMLGVMDPDDQVVAGAWVLAGPPVWLDLIYAARIAWVLPLPAGIGAAGLLAPLVAMPGFLAVTRSRFIVLSMPRRKQASVVLSVPVGAARMTGTRRGLMLDSVRYTGPGVSDLGLSTTRQWRSDFDAVIAALATGGAAVEPPLDLKIEPPRERKQMIKWITGR